MINAKIILTISKLTIQIKYNLQVNNTAQKALFRAASSKEDSTSLVTQYACWV